jgi:hypothetical protein
MEVIGNMKNGIIIAVVFLISSLLYAEKPTYIGAKRCKKCHEGVQHKEVYEKWQQALHAGAFKTLKAKGEEKNPKCLVCHVTGYNNGGYQLGASNAGDFEGVQCEACHGKGSLYLKSHTMKDIQLAVNNGLLIPIEVVCTKCHNKDSPTFKEFNYKEALQVITHRYRSSY